MSPAEAGRTPSTAEAVRQGFSLLLLHNLATPSECEMLRAEASERACAERAEMERASPLEAITDVSTNYLESAPAQVRMPVATMLSVSTQHLCDRILLRGVCRLSRDLPSLLPSLFGDDCRADMPSLTRSDRLVFTPGEPACNVLSLIHI